MLSHIRNLIILAIVCGGALLFSPQPKQAVAQTARAGNYWNNYWRWYDNDYQPYYNRRNRSNYYYNQDFRDNRYQRDPYSGSGYTYPYNNPYNTGYYDNYNRGYRDDMRRPNSVNLGSGFRLQWR